MSYPPAKVLEAFGILNPLKPLSGGRGLCFVANGVVLKPSDDGEESQWVGQLITTLSQTFSSTEYRLPRSIPVVDSPGSFVYDGWTASLFLSGHAEATVRFHDLLRTSRMFHTDIAKLDIAKPTFLTKRRNRFHEADLVTWDEKDLGDVENVNGDVLSIFSDTLDDLNSLKRPLSGDLAFQLIHGDLTGNVLFDGQSENPPGIIDMTFYWRPLAYAEAIIVADGLIWHGQGRSLVEMFGVDDVRLQLLVRALFWRCLAFVIDPDLAFVRSHIPRMDFRGAAKTVREIIDWVKETSVGV